MTKQGCELNRRQEERKKLIRPRRSLSAGRVNNRDRKQRGQIPSTLRLVGPIPAQGDSSEAGATQ